MKNEKYHEEKKYYKAIEFYEKALKKTNKKESEIYASMGPYGRAIELHNRANLIERVKKLKWPTLMI